MTSTAFVYFCIAMSQLWLMSANDSKVIKELTGVLWLVVAIINMFI